MNLISIIMPYYKKKEYIKSALNSVLQQTFKNFEIIIINDDPSEDILFIRNLKKIDKRISVINNKKCIGAGLSRNKGIKFARGNFLAFLDADDLWRKDKLKRQLNFMLKYNINFCFTSYKIVDSNNKVIGSRISKKNLEYQDLIKSCDIGLSTVMLKRKLLKNKLLFPKLKTKEDYVLWLKISKEIGTLYFLKDTLTYWRKLDNSLSSDTIQKLIDGFRVYNYYLKFSIFKSIKSLLNLSLNYLLKK